MRKKTLLLALALALPSSATMASHAGGTDGRMTHRHSQTRMSASSDIDERHERMQRQIERRKARKLKAELLEVQ